MQKIMYVKDGNLEEVNHALDTGWKVVSVTCGLRNDGVGPGDYLSGCAYIVVEKELGPPEK